MRPCRLIGSGRETDRADAAPAIRPRKPGPGRPQPAVRRHHDRPPSMAAREQDEGAVATAPDEVRFEDSVLPGSTAQGDRKRRKWSAGRRLPPIARRKETPRK